MRFLSRVCAVLFSEYTGNFGELTVYEVKFQIQQGTKN